MSYYWFKKQEILQKAKERYSKEKKTAEYYLQNKEAMRKKSQRIDTKLVKRRKRQD